LEEMLFPGVSRMLFSTSLAFPGYVLIWYDATLEIQDRSVI
jgi:hypothetical protein